MPRHISKFFELMRNDGCFRRAIIALPDALEKLRLLLQLPDRHMWHTCMLALMVERADQREKQKDAVFLYVSDVFEQYSKIEDHLDDVHSYIREWWDECVKDFPPK